MTIRFHYNSRYSRNGSYVNGIFTFGEGKGLRDYFCFACRFGKEFEFYAVLTEPVNVIVFAFVCHYGKTNFGNVRDIRCVNLRSCTLTREIVTSLTVHIVLTSGACSTNSNR